VIGDVTTTRIGDEDSVVFEGRIELECGEGTKTGHDDAIVATLSNQTKVTGFG
jgi:hypothetical protein